MSSTPIKALICSVVSLAVMPVLAADMEFTGTAKTETGAILYQEKHRVSGTCQEGVFRPKDHQIGYHRTEAAETFASKDLAYPDSVIRPTVEFLQPDFSESLSIQYASPDTLAIEWQKPNKELKRYDVTYNQDVVVDAGFDTLVRQHWAEVTNGESVNFRFLAPTRGEHYAFVLEPIESARVVSDHVLQIRPTGIVLRFLVEPIILGYSADGALTDYYGLTNIRKNLDTNHTAHIRYSVENYPDCALTP
ncbi:hypothetical protein [Marinobacter sp.]|uniref:hypothetical protein n=1 Tax=Marinobacter sp. TaxID=50741 RepID=UPI00235769E1|nr:hypothetical protein [Marinobacter sp.]